MSADFSRYIGLKYLPGGRDWAGVDCWGLYRLILGTERGVWLPSYTELEVDPDEAAHVADAFISIGVSQEREWIRVEDPVIFDIVLISIAGEPCHVGCYIGDGEMIHSLRGHDSVKEKIGGIKWRRRVMGFWRPAALL